MKFEKFKTLALNLSPYTGNTICRVEVFGLYDEWIDDSGCYGLVKANTSYFPSYGDVLSALPKIYKTVRKAGLKIYCSLIFEIPTDIDMRFERYTRVLSYDADCNLIDHTLCSYPCGINKKGTEIFRGRAKDLIRFQPGDIVEVLSLWEEGEPSVETAIITKTPPTIEESWDRYAQLGDLFEDDSESDIYRYLKGDHWLSGYNTHTAPFLIFKPRVPVPEKRKKELLGFFDNFTGHAFFREGGSLLDEIAQRTAGLSEFVYPGLNNLTPSDFEPIYTASEVIHVSERVDFEIENPLEVMLNRIEKKTSNVLASFSNFIICISNTDCYGKRLSPKRFPNGKRLSRIDYQTLLIYYGESVRCTVQCIIKLILWHINKQ